MDAYSQSGVNLSAARQVVELLSPLAARTRDEHTLTGVGGFAGLMQVPSGYRQPVLAACADGVGSKLQLACELTELSGIGQDLVAMCINDLLCAGAQPWFFLDYLATAKLDPESAGEVLASIAEACRSAEVVLLGGETAEMPGVVPPDSYELAGFAVGICERERLFDPVACRPGDVLLGIASNGLHSNGYSLVRSLLRPEQRRQMVAELLAPTRLYWPELRPVLRLAGRELRGLAHITGGGILENLPRVLPPGLGARVVPGRWPCPAIFENLSELGKLEHEDTFGTFNMGLGMIAVVARESAEAVREEFPEDTYEVGELVEGEGVILSP
jgi:phosphoribosylformylglycinamidine cyclo-ligase